VLAHRVTRQVVQADPGRLGWSAIWAGWGGPGLQLACMGLSAAAGVRRRPEMREKSCVRRAALTGSTIVPKHLTRNRNG